MLKIDSKLGHFTDRFDTIRSKGGPLQNNSNKSRNVVDERHPFKNIFHNYLLCAILIHFGLTVFDAKSMVALHNYGFL